MPTSYIYSPFTGRNWGAATYCFNGAAHPVVAAGSSLPIDVGNPSGTTGLFFAYMSSSVGSIFIGHGTGVCSAASGATAPWQNRIRVKLYSGANNTGTYIGDVVYAHTNYSGYVAGIFNRPSANNWGVALGNTCPDTCNCNRNGCCYCGVHIHMEGRAQTGSLSRTTVGCNGWLYEGSTVIYTYNW